MDTDDTAQYSVFLYFILAILVLALFFLLEYRLESYCWIYGGDCMFVCVPHVLFRVQQMTSRVGSHVGAQNVLKARKQQPKTASTFSSVLPV